MHSSARWPVGTSFHEAGGQVHHIHPGRIRFPHDDLVRSRGVTLEEFRRYESGEIEEAA